MSINTNIIFMQIFANKYSFEHQPVVSCLADREIVYMKKQIIIGITVIAGVALCAAVWPQSAEDKVIPVTPEKLTASVDIAVT
ncbi:MAG: hypothetical protein Q7J78_01445 [Clostridiales bacterium]|nr:hypothetical protein [Clostridiales bacterium]